MDAFIGLTIGLWVGVIAGFAAGYFIFVDRTPRSAPPVEIKRERPETAPAGERASVPSARFPVEKGSIKKSSKTDVADGQEGSVEDLLALGMAKLEKSHPRVAERHGFAKAGLSGR